MQSSGRMCVGRSMPLQKKWSSWTIVQDQQHDGLWLPEEHAQDAPSLAAVVSQRLHDEAPAFPESAVIHAQQSGKPCANKSRRVRVKLASPDIEHAAFKAKRIFGATACLTT